MNAPHETIRVAVGQIREDWHHFPLRIDRVRADGRFDISYPDHDAQAGILSAVVIEQLYPYVRNQ